MRAAFAALLGAMMLAIAALGCGGGSPDSEGTGTGCQAGTETCACGAGNTCSTGLACENGSCVVCPSNQVDCPCAAGSCTGTLVCDASSKKCRSPKACECAPKQVCERLDGLDAVCKPACDPGFDWNANTSKCDPQQTGTSCATSGTGAIGGQCAEVHKACTVIGSRAECGACLSGYKVQGTVCVAVKRCADLDCTTQKRDCVEATTSVDARCTDCQSGYVLAGTSCVDGASCQSCDAQNRQCLAPGSCGECKVGYTLTGGQCVAALTCTGSQQPSCGDRVCVDSSPARCGDACKDPSKRWNGTACVARMTCATLTCLGGQVCVEGHDGNVGGDGGTATNAVDATCSSTCPAGQGVNGGRCVTCASAITCDATQHFTGVVVAEASTSNAACFCEPSPGYFFSNTGATSGQAVPCDADGDGFTNDRVHGLLSSADSITQRKANCSAKVVDRAEFVFASGTSTQYAIGDTAPMSQSSSPAVQLPLYESNRNDGEIGANRATPYGTEDVSTVNSLTKGCGLKVDGSGLPEDLDDNGAPDVSQGATGVSQPSGYVVAASAIPSGLARSSSAALTAIYEKYAIYAHYRELYRVTVEPNVGNASTFKLVVRERPMGAQAANRIAFPEVTCRRADDPHVNNAPYDGTSTAWNRGLTSGRADISETGATADFAWVGRGLGTRDSASTPRFRNHLSWKCVKAVSEADADAESAMIAHHYEWVARSTIDVTPGEPAFSRWVTDGTKYRDIANNVWTSLKRAVEYSFADAPTDRVFRPWIYRVTAATGGYYSAQSAARNSTTVGDVFWMEHRYVPHRGYQRPASGNDARWVTDYEVGCVNECAFDGPARCAQSKANLVVSTAPVGSGTIAYFATPRDYASTTTSPVLELLGGTAYQYLTTDDGRFACTNEMPSVWAAGQYGTYRCGCSGTTAGAACEIGCTTGPGVVNELTTSSDFNIDTRAGAWVCAAPVLASEVRGSSSPMPSGTMTGGGFRLRGTVSDATFGAFESGPGTAESARTTLGARTLWSR